MRCEELPINEKYDVLMDEDDIERIVGKAENSADCYIHFTSGMRKCQYTVVEIKGKKISIAVRQLEKTIKALRRVGREVNFALIVCRGVSRMESRKFVIERGMLYRKKGRERKRVVIDRVPVGAINIGRR